MTVELISWSMSTKVWDGAGIELDTPGSAVRHASAVRHVTECAMWCQCFYVPFWENILKACKEKIIAFFDIETSQDKSLYPPKTGANGAEHIGLGEDPISLCVASFFWTWVSDLLKTCILHVWREKELILVTFTLFSRPVNSNLKYQIVTKK